MKTLDALLIILGWSCISCRSNTENGGTAATTVNEPHNADQNQMNPQPRDRVQQGGKLVWPLGGGPANFNYNQIEGTQLDGFQMIASAMPEPFVSDAAGTSTFNPDYLTGEPE